MQYRLFSMLLELCDLDSVSRSLPNVLSDFHSFRTKFIRVHHLYRISSIRRHTFIFLILETWMNLLIDNRSPLDEWLVLFFLVPKRLGLLPSVASWILWGAVCRGLFHTWPMGAKPGLRVWCRNILSGFLPPAHSSSSDAGGFGVCLPIHDRGVCRWNFPSGLSHTKVKASLVRTSFVLNVHISTFLICKQYSVMQ